VEILDTGQNSESHYYGYFPSVQMLSTGELICDISMDPDQHTVEGVFLGFVISKDKGKTWEWQICGGPGLPEAAYTRKPRPMAVCSCWPDILANSGTMTFASSDDLQYYSQITVTRLFSNKDVRIHLPEAASRQKINDQVCNFASPRSWKNQGVALALF